MEEDGVGWSCEGSECRRRFPAESAFLSVGQEKSSRPPRGKSFPASYCRMERSLYAECNLTKPRPQLGRRPGTIWRSVETCPSQTEEQPYLRCIVCSVSQKHSTHMLQVYGLQPAGPGVGGEVGRLPKPRGRVTGLSSECGPLKCSPQPSPSWPGTTLFSSSPAWPVPSSEGFPVLFKCHLPLEGKASLISQT